MTTDVKEMSRMEKKSYFFDFWKELPTVNIINLIKFREVYAANIRGLIIDVLAEGIPDTYPQSDEIRSRHALSGKEIIDQIGEKHKVDVNKSNFYFHLNILIDQNLVYIVDTLSTGKRQTSYFARKAKIFIVGDIDKKRRYHEIVENPLLKEVIKNISPDVNDDRLTDIFEKLTPINDNRGPAKFAKWAEKHHSDLFNVDLDMRELSVVYNLMFRFNSNSIEGLYQLAKVLKFNFDDPELLNFGQESQMTKDYNADRLLEKSDIFEYWNHVPFLRVFQSEENQQIFTFSNDKQRSGVRIREAIIQLLRKGIDDVIENEDQPSKRYALSVKEILDNLNAEIIKIREYEPKIDHKLDLQYLHDTSIDKPIKKSNLYFHLQKLLDAGFIKDIGSIKKGKRLTTYYGRVAKVFTGVNYSGKKPYPIFENPEFKKLVHRLSPKLEEAKFQDIIKELDRINKYNFYCYPNWLKSVEDEIRGIENINEILISLTNLIALIDRFRHNTSIALFQLANLMGIEQSDR